MKKIFILMLALILALPFLAAPALAEAYVLTLFEPTGLDLSPYVGKALFLNFFTEWCPYCMLEMPDIKRVFDEYSRDELEIILIHPWDREDASHTESVRKRFELEELTFYEDPDQIIVRYLNLPGYPTSLFFDKEGDIAKALPMMLTFEQMAEILDNMGVSRAETSDD